MSRKCRYFVQHAWKQDLCANCFESREEHRRSFERSNLCVPQGSSRNIKGILRDCQNVRQQISETQRKNVVFPESLIEIIGYGGDDLYEDEEDADSLQNDTEGVEGSKSLEDYIPDSEEDRVLNNLTRTNTNFNRITANLEKSSPSSLSNNDVNVATKSFPSLMLGNTQKDAEGKKKTLLVSVTPFGADSGSSITGRSSIIAKRPLENRDIDLRPSIKNNVVNISDADSKEKNQIHEKIIDMPLIQSNQFTSMVEKTESWNQTSLSDARLSIKKSSQSMQAPEEEKKKEREESVVSKRSSCNLRTSVELTFPTKNSDLSREIINDSKCSKVEDISFIQSTVIKEEIVIPDLKERTIEGESVTSESMENYDRQSALQKSREDAGAPDGRADEDEIVEPTVAPDLSSTYDTTALLSPTLPIPIPALPRSSFLHGETNVKDTILPQRSIHSESKPIDVKNSTSHVNMPSHATLKDAKKSNIEKERSAVVEINPNVNSDCSKSNKKDVVPPEPEQIRRRMAPKPPDTVSEDSTSSIFARKPAPNIKSDCPVVREKEKRERATSCSPKFRMADKKSFSQSFSTMNTPEVPEPVNSKRSISLSRYSPTPCPKASMSSPVEEEIKKKSKPRFSLKRLLRMGGSRKDMDIAATGSFFESLDNVSYTPQHKPRPEIIHPLELDGAAVEVLRHDKLIQSPEGHQVESTDSKVDDTPRSSQNITARLGKPPPPPRNSQLQKSNCVQPLTSKSTRAPFLLKNEHDTELSADADNSSWQSTPGHSLTSDSIYANLAAEDVAGEVRSGLAPSKPQRTASLRGVQPQTMMKTPSSALQLHMMNGLSLKREKSSTADTPASLDSFDSTSNDSYDVELRLSSSPECDVSSMEFHNINEIIQANAVDNNLNNERYHHPHVFSRSSTLSYCDMETVSELNVVDGSDMRHERSREDRRDCKSKSEELFRVRQRRSRNMVHRSLEDNYGAVVIANHESLAQLLEQLVQADHSPIPTNLRILKTSRPRLNDFNIDVDSVKIIGKRTFCSATWNEHKLSLCFSRDGLTSLITHRDIFLVPIVEFIDSISDNIPKNWVHFRNNEDVTVSVLRRLQVSTIKLFSVSLPNERQNNEGSYRQCCLVLLQFVNALKNLQARGIEEFSRSLINVILCREEKDSCYRLYLLQSLHVDISDNREDYVSLCQCALVALQELDLMNKLPVIRELLIRERAVSLSQVKAVLEYALWGPPDVILGDWKEREIVLQRWLDLERANVLHTLVRSRTHPSLTVANEYHVTFLVHTTAKIMCEASVLLDEQRSLNEMSPGLLLEKL